MLDLLICLLQVNSINGGLIYSFTLMDRVDEKLEALPPKVVLHAPGSSVNCDKLRQTCSLAQMTKTLASKQQALMPLQLLTTHKPTL